MTYVLAVGTGGGRTTALAVVLAATYLLLVRLLDVNEKEPMWAVGVLFGAGALAGTLLYLVVGSVTLNLTILAGPALQEFAKFLAIAAGVGVVNLLSRPSGLPEVHGILDGIVYGTAAGLGFATGAVFGQQLLVSGPMRELLMAASGVGPFGLFWPLALLGLSHGLFAAITGIGFGVAANAVSPVRRFGAPVVALVVAILVHLGYSWLRTTGQLGAPQLRLWVALFLPLVLVVGAAVWALRLERKVIARELPEEVEGGVVTADEMELLSSLPARRSAYARAFFSGDFNGWLALRSLHNHQVQLAFAKSELRGPRAVDPEAVERVRAAIHQQRVAWQQVAGRNGRDEKAGA